LNIWIGKKSDSLEIDGLGRKRMRNVGYLLEKEEKAK
jgi:hypothetical protein